MLRLGWASSRPHFAAITVCAMLALSTGQACSRHAVPQPLQSQTMKLSTSTTSQSTPEIVTTTDWTVIGKSLRGKPIRMMKLGNGPRTVLFIGGIHGDEAEGAVATAALPDAFGAAGLARTVTLYIIEDANPDGREAATRDNANGVDINRNFPARNFEPGNPAGGGSPVNQPETRAVVETIDRIDPHLVMVVHSWNNEQFVNFDGPAQAAAERFSALSGLPVKASGEFAATPGSLGSYAGRDRGIPVLTIELLKGSDPQMDWRKIHDAVIGAISGD